MNIQEIKITKKIGKDDNTFYLKSKKLVDEILTKTFRPKEKTDFLVNNTKIEQKITVFEILPKKICLVIKGYLNMIILI